MKSSKHKLATFLVALLATTAVTAVLAPASAEAQGRRRGKKPKKGKGSKKGNRAYGQANLILARGRNLEDVRVRADQEGFKEIKYRAKGTSRSDTVKGSNVVDIRYISPASPLFETGRGQIRAGKYKKAATSFTAARREGDDNSWVNFHATYWLGEAKRLSGDYSGAAAEYDRLLKKSPEHWLVPFALNGLGRAHLGAKDWGKAKGIFKKLDSDDFGAIWQARASLGLGDAALGDNDNSGARKAYNLAESRGRSARSNDLRLAAKVGTGKTLIAKKQYQSAIQTFEAIMSEPGIDPEVAGDAWNGKGDCLYDQAKEAGDDKNLLKQALIAYQTCEVRYAGTPEAYPKALFRAAEILEKLGLGKQAGYMRDELKNSCPNSPWTKKLN